MPSQHFRDIWVNRVTLILIAILCTHCTLKKPSPDHTVYYNSNERIPKSFFVSPDVGLTNDSLLGKTFLCGWSPETTAGNYANGMVYYQNAGHCNIQFEITEKNLIGKLIHPSFPNDRSRWKDILTIPITKHFYYEKAKDERGRQTETFVESERSHWSARPYISLDFNQVQINDAALQVYEGDGEDSLIRTKLFGAAVSKTFDIEWDFEKGFLGFSVRVAHPYWGADSMQDVRFNFLQFESNPNFKKTPYHPSNSKHINVLHVLGEKANGTDQILYAGKWDTSKIHEIHLVNFPKEYQSVGQEVIEQWNDVFQKLGHNRPFKAVISERKHAFDLRYPSVVWVADKLYSENAPLGVGMAIADVKNGEIKWGGVTVWGGLIDWLANRDIPASSQESQSNQSQQRPFVQTALLKKESSLSTAKPAMPLDLTQTPSVDSLKLRLSESMRYELVQVKNQLEKIKLQNQTASDEEKVQLLNRQEQLEKILTTQNSVLDQMSADYLTLAGRLQQQSLQAGPSKILSNSNFIQELIEMPKLEDSAGYLPSALKAHFSQIPAQYAALGRSQLASLILNEMVSTHGSNNNSFDSERNIGQVADAWALATGKFKVNKTLAAKAIVKDLLLHEVGHMLGLGHNFKENILPAKGTVPEKYLTKGYNTASGKKMAGLVERAKKDMTNYTTVMGYKNGLTDILISYDDLAPGPMDELVLNYIYNAKYAVLPEQNSGSAEDFEFETLAVDGVIRDQVRRGGKAYRAAYFPACNDVTATYSFDPYCNRWDRGYNATTITQNYFDDFKGNLISSLFAFSNTAKGGSYWNVEGRLWSRALTNFSRARLFYDYMRQKYSQELSTLMSGGEQSSKNLLEFSQACHNANDNKPIENQNLQKLFTTSPRELIDLCLASEKTVLELENLLQLPGKDYTEIDYFDSYVSAGMTGGDVSNNPSRLYGSWKSIARTPIKTSALLALTSPSPFNNLGGWLIPIERYSRQDGSYHLSTFFAKEYTSAIATATEMNLTFGNSDVDKTTTIGRTILTLGNLMQNTYYSNDILHSYTPFIENIRNQANFRYSMAIVEVLKEAERDGEKVARKFTATIHNIYERGPETVPEIFIYTNDRTIVMPTSRSIMSPMSPIRWYSPSAGYYFAVKLDYSDDFYDKLKTKNVRKTLEDAYYALMKKCIQGDSRNGLRYFFNNLVDKSIFPGFDFPEGLHINPSDKNKFFISVDAQFERYYKNDGKWFDTTPNRAYCEEAIRGQSLLVSAASVLNGYYMPGILDFIEKSNSW